MCSPLGWFSQTLTPLLFGAQRPDQMPTSTRSAWAYSPIVGPSTFSKSSCASSSPHQLGSCQFEGNRTSSAYQSSVPIPSLRDRNTSQAVAGSPGGSSKRAAYFPCATTSVTTLMVPRTMFGTPTGPVFAHCENDHCERSPVSQLPEKRICPGAGAITGGDGSVAGGGGV